MTTTENDILGRPIHGDVSNYSYKTPVPQKGPEEFLEVIDTFFAKHPEVTFIRWAQGTPGFNDGEPCTFDINEVRFGFGPANRDELDDEDENGNEYYDRDYGDNSYTISDTYDLDWDHGHPYPHVYSEVIEGHTITEEFHNDFLAVNIAINGGAFEDLVNKKFGDPAEITATREGFNIDYYEIGH